MFGLKKKLKLVTPFAGTVTGVEDVPDPVFGEKMLGDGFAVVPGEQAGVVDVVAPVDGKLVQVFDTAHAFAMKASTGDVELLVHIGLDTVELGGEGLTALAKPGDEVKAGQPIIRADFPAIRAAGKELVTPVVFTKGKQIDSFDITRGEVSADAVVCTATLS